MRRHFIRTKMKSLFTLIFLVVVSYTFAQPINCGSDQLHNTMFLSDPAYKSSFENSLAKVQQCISSRAFNKSTDSVILTIPVVVHILHTGEAIGTGTNLSVLHIQNTIDYLNNIYNGTFSTLENHTDSKIRFVLAKRDENCNSTNGITRDNVSYLTNYTSGGVIYPSTSGVGVDQLVLKDLVRWNPANYLNIYIVNKISGGSFGSGGSGGFAYYPNVNSRYDGIVLTANNFMPGHTALPHEMGHALFLSHPWNGSTRYVCIGNANCTTDGDWVCDTDPITEPSNYTCRTGLNVCSGTDFSVNTEHNLMNYTYCPYLFSNGQIERMQAIVSTLPSRTSFSSSLGGFAPNQGPVHCPPSINFATVYDSIKSSSVSSVGCRSYKDFKYYLNTNNDPSAKTYITITVDSGSAVEHTDFDIYADNTLPVPNNVVTFPTLTDTMQPFWIRVYSNRSSGLSKDVSLGFNLDDGGGNALKGITNTAFKLVIADSNQAPRVTQFSVSKYGDSTNTTLWSPFDGRKKTQKSQFLYKASELIKSGMIKGKITALSLSLLKKSPPGTVYNNLTVKMLLSNRNHLADGSNSDRPLNDQAHPVFFTGDFVPVNGWNTINLASPFFWDGQSSIVITMCYSNTTSDSLEFCGNFKDFTAPSNTSDYVFGKNSRCDTAIGSFLNYVGFRPSFKFQQVIDETIVETASTSSQQYLGPFADVYFYEPVQNKIIARIKNLTSHDYGCTSVSVNRTGNSAQPFMSPLADKYIADKTFIVHPENGNDTGSYEISLYYNSNEINGWQSATGQSFSNMQIVKTKDSISLITPTNTKGAGAFDFAIPGRQDFTNMKVLTARFNSGFSEFGAGVPFTEIYRFTGNGNWSNASNWEAGLIPPANLVEGAAIIVDPLEGGECILDVKQTISTGSILKVDSGRKLKVAASLTVQK